MLVLRYPNVFGPSENSRLYSHAVARRESYSDTSGINTAFYPNWRKSRVDNGDCGGFKQRLQEEVLRRFPEVSQALNLGSPAIAGVDVQMTSHNDGEHYRLHSDNGNAATATRVATFVYYFHRMPKAFTGGHLLVYGTRNHLAPGPVIDSIEPENDLLVFFDPHLMHEVADVSCPSKDFADGRFTLNGWIREKTKPWLH